MAFGATGWALGDALGEDAPGGAAGEAVGEAVGAADEAADGTTPDGVTLTRDRCEDSGTLAGAGKGGADGLASSPIAVAQLATVRATSQRRKPRVLLLTLRPAYRGTMRSRVRARPASIAR